MINLLLGAPGGGKSYEAVVQHVLPALEKGRKVITNLPLLLEAFANIDSRFSDLIELRTESKKEGTTGIKGEDRAWRPFEHEFDYGDPWRRADGIGALYIIDECHLVLPKGSTRKQVEEWFSLHRHENSDVLLITQSYGKISAAIRDLVQVVYRVRKNVALGSMGSYTRKVQDGLRGEVVNSSQRKYERKYYALYRSHTRGRSSDEMGASDIVPIWRHWSFYGVGVCIVTIICIFAFGDVSSPWSVSDSKHQAKQKTPSPPIASSLPASSPVLVPVTSSASVAAASPASAASGPESVEPFGGKGLHLTGWAKFGSREVWTLVLSQNGQAVSTLTSDDLARAGYEWHASGPCAGLVSWKSASRAVVCDLPQVAMMGARSG